STWDSTRRHSDGSFAPCCSSPGRSGWRCRGRGREGSPMSNLSVTMMVDVPVAGGTLAAFTLSVGPEGMPPAVAVHGITSSSRSWVAVARALAGRRELLAVDLRGRGSSRALPPPYGIAAHAADVIALL